MNNVQNKTVTKSLVVFSTLAIISMLTISVLPVGRSSAFDLGMISKDTNIGSIDTHSLFNCFGAAITCDNDNTVNNNVAINNDTTPSDERGTLTVTKEVTCRSTGGTPNNAAVCNEVISSGALPEPQDFTLTVTGNNPNPSEFPGSSFGTKVTLDPGQYTISESIPDFTAIFQLVDASSIATSVEVSGDCTSEGPDVATGTIASGDSQECIINNIVTIQGGTVSGTVPPPEI